MKDNIKNDKMKTLEKEEVSMDSKSQEIYSELSAFLDSIDEEMKKEETKYQKT